KFTTPSLVMTAVTGPNETWFMSGYGDLAAYEADMKKLETTPAMRAVMQQYGPGDAEYISGSRQVIARFRDDLRYNVKSVKLCECLYVQLRTVRIRPGHDGEYAEIRKLVNAAREKSNSPTHSAVYQVISGAPNGTYLLFNPIKTLTETDPVGGPAIAS